MPIPTHREGCETRMWKTSCPDCGKPVWFFSCSCGSKVYFDQKGPPWPQHAEKCTIYNIRLLLEGGSSATQVRKLLESHSKNQGMPIPKEIEEYLSKMGAGGKKIVKTNLPDTNPVIVNGIVKVFNPINLFKKLNILENEINRKVMGKFTSPMFEVIVQEIPINNDRVKNQWTFLIFKSDIEGYVFKVGRSVEVSLEANAIYEDDVFWVCTEWK